MADLKEKIENLQNQRKQVKSDLNDLEDALLKREELLNKIDGAIEVLLSLQEEEKDSKKDKKK